MNKIKTVIVGCGKMSKYTMRYIYEKNATVVGAFDVSEDVIGKDISEIMEAKKEKGVLVSSIDSLDEKVKELKPDIAIVMTMSLINDLHDVLRTLVKNGINVITTCEEAFFVSNSNPKIYKEIDVLAKANNCTVVGSGYQDVFWGNLISVLASSTQSIKKIKGSSSYNVEDYGIALANAHGAGLSLEEFDKNIASADKISVEERQEIINSGNYLPSYMWNTVGWLADKLGLEIISMDQKCLPMTHETDLHSDTLNMDIKAGMATGMSALVTAKTKEGITLEAECIGKVYANDEFDVNEWMIVGEPDTTVTINRPATVELTCADIVNRIPDVINAKSGFVPTSQLDEPKFKLDLNDYVK